MKQYIEDIIDHLESAASSAEFLKNTNQGMTIPCDSLRDTILLAKDKAKGLKIYEGRMNNLGKTS